ncbi:RNA polymerase sigma-70 factor [Dyadobacter luteus]|nr:RNA polymerase sigma-70 factor [Dyadobacter luteus]
MPGNDFSDHYLFHEVQDMISREWFEQVYKQYVKKLCTICYNVVGDEEVAREIVHNVFLSVWERRDVLDLHSDIEHYMVRAVKLSSLEHLRTSVIRQKHLSIIASRQNSQANTTEQQIGFSELKSRIELLTSELPPQCRQVFNLSRDKGLSNKEIASLLNISEKTVEAHLSKALKYLRSQLNEFTF